MSLFSKVLGDPHKREINRHMRVVEEINSLEEEMRALSDEELRHKTDEFRERLGYEGADISFGQTYAEDLDALGETAERAAAEFASGDVSAESEAEIERQFARREKKERELEQAERLDEILPEAFAVVREASRADRDAPLRRPAGRRHRPARGQDRRDEDRRGQDAGRHRCRSISMPSRQGRPPGNRQRLPGQARPAGMGPSSTSSDSPSASSSTTQPFCTTPSR